MNTDLESLVAELGAAYEGAMVPGAVEAFPGDESAIAVAPNALVLSTTTLYAAMVGPRSPTFDSWVTVPLADIRQTRIDVNKDSTVSLFFDLRGGSREKYKSLAALVSPRVVRDKKGRIVEPFDGPKNYAIAHSFCRTVDRQALVGLGDDVNPSLIRALLELMDSDTYFAVPETIEGFPRGVEVLNVLTSSQGTALVLTAGHIHKSNLSITGVLTWETVPLAEVASIKVSGAASGVAVEIGLRAESMRAIAGSQFRQQKVLVFLASPRLSLPAWGSWSPSDKQVNTLAEKFTLDVRSAIAQSGEPAKVDETKVDPLDAIRKLKELLDMGALTQDEFEAKKRDYL